MADKLPAEVSAHLHGDSVVTPERVRAFGRADYAFQLHVLAVLRARSADQSLTSMVALFALGLTLLLVLVKPPTPLDFDGEWWVVLLYVPILAILIVLTLSPAIISGALGNSSQVRARVWLGAYEDEIARRQNRKGKRT